MNALYHAHSGLRYLVLLAALAAITVLAVGLARRRASRLTRVLPSIFSGLLDLQLVLGAGLVMGGIFPAAAIGHLVMMVLAAAVTHASSITGRRARDDQREMAIRLAGVAVASILVVGGIMAIGRSVFGSLPLSAP